MQINNSERLLMTPSVIYERQLCGKSAQLGVNDCFEAGKFRCYRACADPKRTVIW